MKLVDATLLASLGAVRPVSAVVLQVTARLAPSADVGMMKMRLFAVTAVVFTTHVAVEAFVAHEKAPEDAAAHATSDGLAALPAAAQLGEAGDGDIFVSAGVTALI